MFYTIYRITNLLDGTEYIGKHQTNNLDDGYMGSGSRLLNAMKKHGKENFKKEIIFIFETEDEMNTKESEIVNEQFCSWSNTYNICVGGKGGWSYVNKAGLGGTLGYSFNEDFKEKQRRNTKNRWDRGLCRYVPTTNGFKFSDASKSLMAERASGEKNSQFGTIWITNGLLNKKIRKEVDIPEGWYKGRVTKFL